MCPSNAGAAGDSPSPNVSTSIPAAIPSEDVLLQRELDRVPREVLAHVVDVHCHPTDSDFGMTSEFVKELPIRICAMSTRRSDQELVAKLAQAHPEKVIPCFGWSIMSSS